MPLDSGGGAPAYVPPNINARIENSANESIPNNAASVITFDTAIFNHGPMYAAGSPSKLTAPVAGLYHIYGEVEFPLVATGAYLEVFIRLNGVTYIGCNAVPAQTNSVDVIPVVALYHMNATDYVELVVIQTSGGALNVNADGHISPVFGAAILYQG